MPSLRQAVTFAVRLVIVTVVPLGGLVVVALGTRTLGVELPLVIEAGLAFALLTAVCGVLQRFTRFVMGLRWLPLAFAGFVLIGVSGAKNFYDDLTRVDPLPDTAAVLDVLLIQPASSASAVEPVRDLFEGPENRLRADVKYSIASISDALGGLQLHLEGKDRSEALRALIASKGSVDKATVLRPDRLLTWTGWRPKAARAVVLNVDGIDAFGKKPIDTKTTPSDWEAVLGRSPLPRVFVILGAASDERLRLWQTWAASHGGLARRARDLGKLPLVDAAFHLATARDANADRALAFRYRPKLFFDSHERYSTPLDVEEFLASPSVEACRDRRWRKDKCWPATVERLSERRKYLRFDHTNLPPMRSAIYFHAVAHGDDLHLDYWWYLPYNPTASDHDVPCGPGATIPGATCFDHQSDWEGITVVLEKDGDDFAPRDVIYAQHEFGVAYSWDDLQERWKDHPKFDGERPLVFVARDSHASYPTACAGDCFQVHMPSVRYEGDHDGAKAYDEDTCGTTCLQPFPQSKYGEPAEWNALPLPWGRKDCFLEETICKRLAAPKAPSFQARFWVPWQPLESVDRETTDFGGLDVSYVRY